MADAKHLALLRNGVSSWNAWRRANPTIRPDLRGANLDEADLSEVDLGGANLSWTDLSRADLHAADLRGANLYDVNLGGADLRRAKLADADLSRAYLRGADLARADLDRAHLIGADLWDALLTGAHLYRADLTLAALDRAHLYGADLTEANLTEADLTEADLSRADLTGANLTRADLTHAILTETSFVQATLDGCRVYGVAGWNARLDGALQTNLRISREDEPEITVDNLETAQFLYLVLHSETVRQVVELSPGKIALVLGQFASERQAVLDALRAALRQSQHAYVPVHVVFDDASESGSAEILTRLAQIARFIIADVTGSASVQKALREIAPHIQAPVLPISAEGSAPEPNALPAEEQDFPWMLPLYRYPHATGLAEAASDAIIAPAEARLQELRAVHPSDAAQESDTLRPPEALYSSDTVRLADTVRLPASDDAEDAV